MSISRDITIMVLDDCPNRDLALDRVNHAARNLGASVIIEVPQVQVLSSNDAAVAGFHGSPTILVDGTDPFPVADGTTVACRLYATERGLEGAPSVRQLEEVLRR
ncbi:MULTISPECIES: hypothetical protein [unclassified Nocardioides]|uniref:hypothetical protein n=1 Tax=unclassified Nocardioides TaxID=2615069 RepID=UPI0009F01443|nr:MULTISPECIES: hypothetical protein [unclassified Nocardioides]GAW49228.1 Putative alkylmercury lyase family protein [Nocardioides sp. PD653-B2]GAW55716.1 putative alkylmercury lyase family protein [Nocardioides sp. PD653]